MCYSIKLTPIKKVFYVSDPLRHEANSVHGQNDQSTSVSHDKSICCVKNDEIGASGRDIDTISS